MKSTHWLSEELGFDGYQLKMCPNAQRWEHCMTDPKDAVYSCITHTFKSSHSWFKNMVWESHLNEFLEESQIETEKPCFYLLRQSGPGWVRWYAIFGDSDESTEYYIAVVFEDTMTAFTYRLSI